MHKFKAYIWYCLTIITIFGLYQVKYSVIALEDELKGLNRQIIQTQEELHILEAEWTALNHPQRLEELNEKFVHLIPLTNDHIQEVESIAIQDE